MSKVNDTVFGGKDNPESMWGPGGEPKRCDCKPGIRTMTRVAEWIWQCPRCGGLVPQMTDEQNVRIKAFEELVEAFGYEDVEEVAPEDISGAIIASAEISRMTSKTFMEEVAKLRKLLGECADCMDDCLVKIYPEEFDEERKELAGERFSDGGGIIGRIADLADGARSEAAKEPTA